MARTVLAIDIDSTTIRLLESSGNRVERWVSAPLDTGAGDGARDTGAQVGAQLKRLMRSSGVGKGEVVASVSGLYSMSRVLNIPPKTRGEVLREAPQLARESIPLEQMKVIWKLLPADETGQEMLVLGVPPAALEAQMVVLRSAGIRPRALELRGVALVRAVDRERAIIINLESSATDLVLVMNGVPRVMRTIQQHSDLSQERKVASLAGIVEQTVSYYNANNPGRPITDDVPLVVVGSLAEDPGVEKLLSQELRYPVEPFAPSLELPPHLPAARYAVGIGLTLRRASRPRQEPSAGGAHAIDINLIPQTPPFWVPTPGRAAYVAGLVAGLAVAFLLFQAADSAGLRRARLETERATVQGEVSQMRAELGEITRKEAVIKQFEELTSRQGKTTRWINVIRGLVPQGIAVNSFGLTATGLTISGTYDSPQTYLDFVRVLNASGEKGPGAELRPYFKSTSISSVGQGPGTFTFPLSFAK